MKKIAFILPEGSLPIPAVMGGAIETLMTMLLEQNEVEKKFQFVFVYSGDKNERIEYENSVCYCCKLPEKKKEKLSFWDKVWYKLGTFFPKYFPSVSKYYRDACKIARKEKADFVIAEGLYPTNFSNFRYYWNIEKLAIHIHSEVEKPQGSDEIAGKTLAISDFVADRWNEKTPDKRKDTFVFKNSITREKFDINMSSEEIAGVRKAVGFEKDDFVVFFCGRMIQVKGVRELIWAVLNIHNPKIKLLLIGSDDFARGDKGEYAKEIKTLVLENRDRITHLGYVDNGKLYQYYKSADLQVVPSLWEEAAGLVAIEGMICKIPQIVTKSGGMVEYVNENYTKIIPKDDTLVSTLSEQIQFLYENPKERERMAQGAYEWSKQFSKEHYYQRFCEIMSEWK